MKHGVVVNLVDPDKPDVAVEDRLEFWWAGEQVDHGEFNKRSIEQMRAVAKDVDAIQIGMDLHEMISGGEKASAELDLLEKILRAPLCEVCRMMIENIRP